MHAQQGWQVVGPVGVRTSIAWFSIVISSGLPRPLLFTPDPRKSAHHVKRCMRHVYVIIAMAPFGAVSLVWLRPQATLPAQVVEEA
jgi:hypothetical protein